MEAFFFLFFILLIPTIFLILFICNIVKIIKIKKSNDTVKKSIIVETVIFGIIFLLIACFYLWMLLLLSSDVSNM